MNDEVAMNLLYIQAIAEIHWGWILITDELKNQLTDLQKHGKKIEVCLYIYIYLYIDCGYLSKCKF